MAPEKADAVQLGSVLAPVPRATSFKPAGNYDSCYFTTEHKLNLHTKTIN